MGLKPVNVKERGQMENYRMKKPILYLLAPGFADNGRREYCPECAEMWGVLSYFPAIKEAVEIRYTGIGHPRQEIVDVLGAGQHNCPTLVLPKGAAIPDGVRVKHANGYDYLPTAKGIGIYFAKLYGTPLPRGNH